MPSARRPSPADALAPRPAKRFRTTGHPATPSPDAEGTQQDEEWDEEDAIPHHDAPESEDEQGPDACIGSAYEPAHTLQAAPQRRMRDPVDGCVLFLSPPFPTLASCMER